VCGIAGYVGLSDNVDLDSALTQMQHRGPDGRGKYLGSYGDFKIGLGHLRLSIVDLTDAASQPFRVQGDRYVLVFNGEIYNYESLRQELIAKGRVFTSRSDTEVLLASYQEWGCDCVRHFEGMFAFVLFDNVQGSVFFARDPLGIKPLYLMGSPEEGQMIFASEIRGIRALADRALVPDSSTFAEFLLNGFLYEPRTGFESVWKLGPGEALEISLENGNMRKWAYHDPFAEPAERDFDAAIGESMHLQSLADVKVGLFFSGGVDSSVLAAASDQPLKGLHAVYTDPSGRPTGDSVYAKEISGELGLSVEDVVHEVGNQDHAKILDEFRSVARGTEEPISDYTYVASEMISGLARGRGYKVMLSGMGGDELFAGYPRYVPVRYMRWFRVFHRALSLLNPIIRRLPKFAKKADRLLRFSSERDFATAYTSMVGYFSAVEVSSMLGNSIGVDQFRKHMDALLAPVRSRSPLKQAMYLDRYGFLAHNLAVTDKSSMAQSIEVRVPLMSRDLAALGLTLSDESLLVLNETKRPLRRYLARRLPAKLVNRSKVGFNPPLEDKIAILGEKLISEILSGKVLSAVVDPAFSLKLVKQHFAGQANNTYRLWQLLYFSMWLEEASSAA